MSRLKSPARREKVRLEEDAIALTIVFFVNNRGWYNLGSLPTLFQCGVLVWNR
ncbi:hypothetical protein I8752_33345 [Nostocaceae cyanobacterium CENA369]|uniref:Uncharacterized protein n=1 Tax=Dendronalium phyllosphericum CENA369 TaxID=1725256 RepID=A0A8J7IME7_9NOST|nr:hypothetical protein [Dendronalium phyllosphericum]MBH8577767.1 hypothetical protein [Dendronalium phyllosphericum CENA369]